MSMYLPLLETLADLFPFIVPLMAACGLVAAQCSTVDSIRRIATGIFFGSLVVVALGAYRSMLHSEPTWLLHTASLGALIVGASVVLITSPQPVE
jgi:hypothetical protein